MITEKGGVVERVRHHLSYVAVGVDAADMLGRSEGRGPVVEGRGQLPAEHDGVLVDEHVDRDAGHVQPVQEVRDAVVHAVGLVGIRGLHLGRYMIHIGLVGIRGIHT